MLKIHGVLLWTFDVIWGIYILLLVVRIDWGYAISLMFPCICITLLASGTYFGGRILGGIIIPYTSKIVF